MCPGPLASPPPTQGNPRSKPTLPCVTLAMENLTDQGAVLLQSALPINLIMPVKESSLQLPCLF